MADITPMFITSHRANQVSDPHDGWAGSTESAHQLNLR